MKKIFVIIASLVFLTTTACSAGIKTKDPLNNPIEVMKDISTQSADRGVVTGKIITETPQGRIGLMIYLGDIVLDSKGFVGGFLDKQRAPYAMVNGEDGVFTIYNVPPGQYSLIIYEVVFGGQAYNDEDGNIKILEVEPGKTLDLGEIQVSGF